MIGAVRHIGNEHVARGVGDRERHARRRHRRLGRHTAGPEHRDFAGLDAHGIAEIGSTQVLDAQQRGLSDMHRSAVDRRITPGDATGLGHTISRVTQFHDLIETTFSIQRFSPALFAVKGVRFQPIDTRDVATHLVSLLDKGPVGRVDDIGGPAVFGHDELARMYLTSRGSRRRVLALPLPGGIGAGLRSGANLVPANPVGTIGFAQYLARTT